MKKITMFMIESCPYCQAARRWMDELKENNPDFKDLEIEMIDENVHPEIANQYDYHYVPTYYIEDEKVHEGAANLRKVNKVLKAALKA